MKWSIAAATVIGFAGATLGQTASFNLVGVPSSGSFSEVHAISADGSVATGYSRLASGASPGFTWTSTGGRSDFGQQAGMPRATYAWGISGDGAVVVGQFWALGQPPQVTEHAFRWTGTGPVQDLGVLSGYDRSWAEGASGDGSVVVGKNERGPNTDYDGQAYRWTAGGGMQGLGFARPGDFYSEATAISRDGATVVGWSANPGNGSAVPFTWTSSGGMHALPGFVGAPFTDGQALAVNASGLIIVGESDVGPTGNVHPAMWAGGSIVDLGLPAGYAGGQATALSSDGSVVGGQIIANGNTADVASVWTAATGTEPLVDYLTANGVLVPSGVTLDECTAISDNGLVFGGNAVVSGQEVGFVATIPAPSSLAVLAVMCRPRQRGGGRA